MEAALPGLCPSLAGASSPPRPSPSHRPRDAPALPGFFVATAKTQLAVPPDRGWVEVMHVARREDHREKNHRASMGQFWYWLARGSGIWLNLGRSWRVGHDTEDELHRMDSPGCEAAAARGYDTIILLPARPRGESNGGVGGGGGGGGRGGGGGMWYGGAVELVDCRAARRGASLDVLWEGPCPPPNATPLRTGSGACGRGGRWRRTGCACWCEPSLPHLNCRRGGSS